MSLGCMCAGQQQSCACSGGLSGMGDICTTPMCSEGAASVDQMMQMFQALGSPEQFRVQITTIKANFDATYTALSPWIPFNPNCCAVLDIGKQADSLTNQMAAFAGLPAINPGPSTQPAGADPLSSALGLATLVAIGVLAVQAKGLFSR